MSYDAMKKALNALDETRQAISGAYSAGYQAGKDNSDIAIDELEQENRLLRARNDRLEKEISKLQENGCKFPLCQNEEHQQGLAEQIKRELYTGQPAQLKPLTDEQRNTIISQECRYTSEAATEDHHRLIEAVELLHGIKEKNT